MWLISHLLFINTLAASVVLASIFGALLQLWSIPSNSYKVIHFIEGKLKQGVEHG
jgi:hypothetical protein